MKHRHPVLTANRRRNLTANVKRKKVKSVNPLRIDPTRTITLRRAFCAKIKRKFALLKGRIVKLFIDQDVLGLNRPVHNIASVPVIRQTTTYSCGAACFAAVARFYSVEPAAESAAVAALGTTAQEGTSPTQILQAAQDAGLAYAAYYGMSIGDLEALNCPVIVSVWMWGGGHYVVVTAVRARRVEYMDPSAGYASLPCEEFESLWYDDEGGERLGIVLWKDAPTVNSIIRDAIGRFAASAGSAEHAVAAKIGSIVKSLPTPIRAPMMVAYHTISASFTAGQVLAERVAKERGLSDDQAHRLRGVLATVDALAAKPAALLGGATGVGHALGFVPLASTGYLMYSTARNPLATYRAAKGLIGGGVAWGKGAVHTIAHPMELVGNVEGDQADLLAAALQEHDFDDWYIALLHAALEDRTPAEAVKAADRVYKEYPTVNARDDQPRVPAGSPEGGEFGSTGGGGHKQPVAIVTKDGDVYNATAEHTKRAKLTANKAEWAFLSDPEKIEAFQAWLSDQLEELLLNSTEEDLWLLYTQQGFMKGAGRAFDDVNKARQGLAVGDQAKLDFYDGTKDQFLRSAFGQAVSVEKVKLLAGRSFDDLEGVTSDMSTKMSRALTDGLVEGKGAREVARDLADQADLSRERALTVARTEIVRAHAEGQLDAMDEMGVEEIGVAVEVSVTQDNALCDECSALDGIVLSLDEAHGLIPVHPNCFLNPNTLVQARGLWKPIGGEYGLQVGDEVLTHLNRYRKVTQLHRSVADVNIVRIRTSNSVLEVTEDHPVFSKREWVLAKDIKAGDTVTLFWWNPSDWDKREDRSVTKLWHEVKVAAVDYEWCKGAELWNISVEEDESYLTQLNPMVQGTAYGMGAWIVHNCRCAFLPANVGEDKKDQTRSKSAIDKAGVAAGLDLDVDEDRPESILDNFDLDAYLGGVNYER